MLRLLNSNNKVYITSDLHLDHMNIIKYCNRPYKLTEEDTLKMQENLLSKIDRLPANCTLINNGDLLNTKEHELADVKKIVDRMKGPKRQRTLILVLGNHDICKLDGDRTAFYLAAGFDKVFESPVIVDDKIILSHEPVYLAPNNNLINLYGHTHNENISEDYFTYDFDNWAMIAKVCRKDGLPEPNLEDYKKWPDRKISSKNYFNVCWDSNYKILNYKDLVKSFK